MSYWQAPLTQSYKLSDLIDSRHHSLKRPDRPKDYMIGYGKAESTELAVREVYGAYSARWGEGAPPEPEARKPTTEANARSYKNALNVDSNKRLRATRPDQRPENPCPPYWIFAGMAALIGRL